MYNCEATQRQTEQTERAAGSLALKKGRQEKKARRLYVMLISLLYELR